MVKKMRKIFCVMLTFALSLTYSYGKGTSKRPNSFNFNKGIECIEQQDYKNAYDYFYNELKDNPKSGYAQYWLGYIRMLYSEYGRSLDAFSEAISLLPSKDTPYLQSAYSGRASVYLNLGDTAKALSDISTGIKLDPSNVVMYSDRAEIYFELEKYSLADAEYQKIIKINPGSLTAYMGLGRNLKEQGKYEEAIKKFDYVVSLDPEYPDAYAFRADAYNELKKYDEATTDVVTALKIQADQRKALRLMLYFDKEPKELLLTKMKAQMIITPDTVTWPYYIGEVYESMDNYKDAIPYYDKALSIEFVPSISRRLSYSYRQLGAYDDAMKYIDLTIKLDSTEYDELTSKADIYACKGDLKSAISLMDEYVKKRPDYNFAYRKRGVFKMENKQFEDALEDFDMAITLAPKVIQGYNCRARVYEKLGKKDKAEADFKKIIELDPEYKKSYSTAFALQFLGKTAEAEKAMNEYYQNLKMKEEKSFCYNMACLYSIMGKTKEAIDNLRKALELGWRDLYHLETDMDLDNIRALPEFKSLLQEYKGKLQEELKGIKNIKSNVNIEEKLKMKDVEMKNNEL